MEFLKELFNGGSMTYEQLQAAAGEKGFQVVNAAGGSYVPKAELDNLSGQVDTLTGQLSEANTKLTGYDPSWREKAETARQELESQQFDFALERALAAAKPRNAKAVVALLDKDKLKLSGGEIIGLEQQLNALKAGEDTAFLFQEDKPPKSGLSHQNGRQVGGNDKKDAANEALRSLFGSAE